MCVQRIPVRDADVAHAEETVIAAAQRMHSRKVGTLVVIGELQRPIGLVTDRDLAIRVVARARDLWQTKVREVMTETPCVIECADADRGSLTRNARQKMPSLARRRRRWQAGGLGEPGRHYPAPNRGTERDQPPTRRGIPGILASRCRGTHPTRKSCPLMMRSSRQSLYDAGASSVTSSLLAPPEST